MVPLRCWRRRASIARSIQLISAIVLTRRWHWGFAAAGVGMTFGLIVYVLLRERIAHVGHAPAPGVARPWGKLALVLLGAAALLAVVRVSDTNENFRWRDSHRKVHQLLTRAKNLLRRKKKGEIARDYQEGVYRVCHKLIELGCAEPSAAAAGSMFVLRKLRDLPEDFAERFGPADAIAAAQAAFSQYSRASR